MDLPVDLLHSVRIKKNFCVRQYRWGMIAVYRELREVSYVLAASVV
jgi:hypothetical protein